MADNVVLFFTIAGIVVFGFMGEQFFKRTGIPSFLFLIVIGIILGPLLDIFPGSSLFPILGVFAEVTLLMVLFTSGLEMKIASALQGSGRAVTLVVLYVALSTTFIGIFCHYMLGWDFVEAFAFGAIIGGQTSTPIVVPLAKSLRLPEQTVSVITLESVMNSIFGIVLFFTFVNLYKTGIANLSTALSGIASNFSIGIVFGFLISLAWILVLEYFKDQRYTYVLTLGLLFATFSLTVSIGGSGELAVFVFGLLLGNYSLLNRLRKKQIDLEGLMRPLSRSQDEVSFLLNTLFFVFLGLTFQLNLKDIISNLMIAASFLAILLVSRYVSVNASTAKSPMKSDRSSILLLCGQGVTQATLAIIAINEGMTLGNLFLSLVAYVIIATNVVTAVGSVWMMQRRKFDFKTFMDSLDTYLSPKGT